MGDYAGQPGGNVGINDTPYQILLRIRQKLANARAVASRSGAPWGVDASSGVLTPQEIAVLKTYSNSGGTTGTLAKSIINQYNVRTYTPKVNDGSSPAVGGGPAGQAGANYGATNAERAADPGDPITDSGNFNGYPNWIQNIDGAEEFLLNNNIADGTGTTAQNMFLRWLNSQDMATGQMNWDYGDRVGAWAQLVQLANGGNKFYNRDEHDKSNPQRNIADDLGRYVVDASSGRSMVALHDLWNAMLNSSQFNTDPNAASGVYDPYSGQKEIKQFITAATPFTSDANTKLINNLFNRASSEWSVTGLDAKMPLLKYLLQNGAGSWY